MFRVFGSRCGASRRFSPTSILLLVVPVTIAGCATHSESYLPSEPVYGVTRSAPVAHRPQTAYYPQPRPDYSDARNHSRYQPAPLWPNRNYRSNYLPSSVRSGEPRSVQTPYNSRAPLPVYAQHRKTDHRRQPHNTYDRQYQTHAETTYRSTESADTYLQPMRASSAVIPKHSSRGAIIIVREGDTLFGLAQRHNVTVEQLMRTNRLTSENIEVGQNLVLPPRY